MRKNTLATSIAILISGLAGAAHADVIPGTGAANPTTNTLGLTNAVAMVVSAGGIGHQLLTPYFNAQNGNATIISVTNTDTVNGKVMKVRFRGASNSDDILDFTVLMSPGDVWNATVTAPTTTSPAQIMTQDLSCSLPELKPGIPVSFITDNLTTKGGNDVNNNTREGYIEIFNMADVPPTAQYGAAGNAQSELYKAIKHVAGVPPCNYASVLHPVLLDNNWTVEGDAATRGLATPTTGLFGNWVIINVPQTTTYSGEMVAIRAVDAAGVDARANYVVFRQVPDAYPGAIDNVTADPLLRTQPLSALTAGGVGTNATGTFPAKQPAHFDLPDMSTPYVTPAAGPGAPLAQAAALTGALAVRNIMNEYATDSIISAKTDWVFSMPTRRYSVVMDYTPTTSRRLFSRVVNAANNPWFYDGNTSINSLNQQQICVTATNQTFYDREEKTQSSGAVFSPGSVSRTQFCGETSVLSFAAGINNPSVLGGSVARQDTGSSAFVNGWGNVNVTNGATGLGLPILGSSFIKASNPNASAGTSGTYGITSAHRSVR